LIDREALSVCSLQVEQSNQSSSPASPSSPLSDLVAIRRQKLQAIRDLGIDPFGGLFETTGSVAEVRDGFAEGRVVTLAGRITAYRDMGKSRFLDLSDMGGRMQVYVNAKEVVWCQEEPANMGSWHHLLPILMKFFGRAIGYAGREASASTAVGTTAAHKLQQAELIAQAFGEKVSEK